MNGLDAEYSDDVSAEFRNAYAPESKKEIADYGFDNHGMVIFDGKDQLSQKLNGHKLSEAEIREALGTVLKSG